MNLLIAAIPGVGQLVLVKQERRLHQKVAHFSEKTSLIISTKISAVQEIVKAEETAAVGAIFQAIVGIFLVQAFQLSLLGIGVTVLGIGSFVASLILRSSNVSRIQDMKKTILLQIKGIVKDKFNQSNSQLFEKGCTKEQLVALRAQMKFLISSKKIEILETHTTNPKDPKYAPFFELVQSIGKMREAFKALDEKLTTEKSDVLSPDDDLVKKAVAAHKELSDKVAAFQTHRFVL